MDKYSNFAELQGAEREDKDYRVVICERETSSTVIIAPHGGGIEPGTSEIALGIAADDLSVALFKGTKTKGNGNLHITSTNFDEPKCIALVQTAQNVIAIHGEGSNNKIVCIGGADTKLGAFIRASLEANGFQVKEHHNSMLQGKSSNNICNRGIRRMGVQLELAAGLRETFFESLTAKGRGKPTENLCNFSHGVREGLRSAGAL
ncbi:MAG: poly-gamma-glutamate hydrolase family protein [Proteobacteria bacterium]|nr:poly-gamma-glutamate hydrolase family protein [Pseudomonadota bacterium]MBU4068508.1 poly-gamma-glutamate hydrolase family protein [Pseudomonadota bacterium]MBU4099956.1 poly-gamma-glutamate hydrolase family protein [Pseudomonadota bacterium]